MGPRPSLSFQLWSGAGSPSRSTPRVPTYVLTIWAIWGRGWGMGAVTGRTRSRAAPRLRTLTCQSLAAFLTGTPLCKLKLRHEGALLSLNFLFSLVPLTPLLGAHSPPTPKYPFPSRYHFPSTQCLSYFVTFPACLPYAALILLRFLLIVVRDSLW